MSIPNAPDNTGLSEANTRDKLIDLAIHKCGRTEEMIRREETAGSTEIVGVKARRRSRGQVDYTLRLKVAADAQPVAYRSQERSVAARSRSEPGQSLLRSQ